MVQLTLIDAQACILAAYASYLNNLVGNVQVNTSVGPVNVTCLINQGRFNCGFPGFYIDQNNLAALRAWCINNPGAGWSFGFRGSDHNHADSVNITLINKTPLMFNFHVYFR